MLTEKQKAFCDYYIQTLNATESYLKAGYSVNEPTARANASRLLTKANIKNYIKERSKQIEDERIAGMKEVQEFWSETMRGKRNKLGDRLKASEYLARASGAFLDKVEHSGDIDITVGFSDGKD